MSASWPAKSAPTQRPAKVAKTKVPGVYAVRVADGEISRVEILYGVIAGADPRMADELAAALFPVGTPVPTVTC